MAVDSSYVCPQCGPDPAGPEQHTRTHHVFEAGDVLSDLADMLDEARTERDRARAELRDLTERVAMAELNLAACADSRRDVIERHRHQEDT